MNPDTKILIVGAGAFGTSTAYHLSQRGFKSIRVLDRSPPPSADAAANDISKIIRSDYNQPLYARLGIEAIEEWRSSPLFRDLYHVPGWVLSAENLSVPFVEGSIRTLAAMGVRGVERLTAEQVRERYPTVTGKLDGWNVNVWNPTAGWAAADEALRRMALAAQRNGVEYISGDDKGYVRKLNYSPSSSPDSKNKKKKTCTGVSTADGTTYTADMVVVSAGAGTPSLLDLQGQITAKGHSVAHIQLSPDESRQYEDLPILDSLELGYYLPPQRGGVFKMAHSQFVKNTRTDPETGIRTSVPHQFTQNPTDDLPLEIEASMRRNLRRVFPELADRTFSYSRLCWDADTPDRHFLITPYPEHAGLFVATGGSAHGFKFLPVLGKYIADLLQGNLEEDIVKAWAWRPDQQEGKKDLAHMEEPEELDDLTGWKGRRERENRMVGAAKL